MSQNAFIEAKRPQLAELCRRHRVQQLELFGSATGQQFDPDSSDFDFLVQFQPMPPVEHGDSYWRLLEDLEKLLGRPVDLVELAPIRNPYFLQGIEASRVVLYAA
jgi:predicted nucleotidyltransferase